MPFHLLIVHRLLTRLFTMAEPPSLGSASPRSFDVSGSEDQKPSVSLSAQLSSIRVRLQMAKADASVDVSTYDGILDRKLTHWKVELNAYLRVLREVQG